MGMGRFRNGRFDIVVSFDGRPTADEWFAWERAFEKASEILFNATESQGRFGRIYVCDERVGRATADFVVHDGSGTSTNQGRFGEPGTFVDTFLLNTLNRSNATHGVLMLVHEWGHHAWALQDERTGPFLRLRIDAGRTPGRSIIPLEPGQADRDGTPLGPNSLLRPAPRRRRAILGFAGGNRIERRTITANTALELTVDNDFPADPADDIDGIVFVDESAECGNQSTDNFCIMETPGTGAGRFSALGAAGVWQPAANPVTEFCSAGNHDQDMDTGVPLSCWQQIENHPDYVWNIPNPPSPVPRAGFVAPQWILLDKQPRFVLALDRSWSMSEGDKMTDARHGAIYWLERAAEADDRLAVLWYDHEVLQGLALTEVRDVGDLGPLIADIRAVEPRGSTNIRDSLRAAQDEIESLPTRAAVQAVLLLSDGIHNSPPDSSPMEVVGDLQDGGIRVYGLGVGDAGTVDMETLESVSEETGGRAFRIGDAGPGEIERRMVEINTELREGIVTTQPALMPEPEPGIEDSDWKQRLQSASSAGRPALKDVLRIEAKEAVAAIFKPGSPFRGRAAALPVDIEKKSRSASFTLIYPESDELWLYLIDPQGEFVDMTSDRVRLVVSTAPHEFALVDSPTPGRWWVVALRAEAGSKAIPFHLVAGSKNPFITTFGGADAFVPENRPVRLWASVRWDHVLSRISARAVVRGPSGFRREILLNDKQVEEPQSGAYEGFFVPEHSGRYQGEILVRCDGGKAVEAGWMHRAKHDEDSKTWKTRSHAPDFVRTIPFTFEVGPRKTATDEEKRKQIIEEYRRRRPAPVSAKS